MVSYLRTYEYDVDSLRVGDQVQIPHYVVSPMFTGLWADVLSIEDGRVVCKIITTGERPLQLTIRVPLEIISSTRRVVESTPTTQMHSAEQKEVMNEDDGYGEEW